jgi:hypothetical protein
MTAAEEVEKCSVISATALTFSVFGMCYLLSFLHRAGRPETRNAPAQGARGGMALPNLANLRGPLRRSGGVRSRART